MGLCAARWYLLALIAAVSGGCISDSLVSCGAYSCPSDSVCTTSGGCAFSDQVSACTGVADLATCDTKEFTGGVCLAGVCMPIVCGDGVVVPPEVCDDGNQLSGDGCSADCRSTEVCGNGIVDGAVGEQCDNLPAGLSHDGCTSACTIEFELWNDVTPRLPDADTAPSMAYDRHRGRIVMVTSNGDTWEWDGIVWRQPRPTISPPVRADAAMAYDPVLDQLVLYGGTDGNYKNDTWQWDGSAWTQLAPAPVMAPVHTPLVYDAADHEIIALSAGTTLAWTGTAWSAIATTGPTQTDIALAYDASGSQVLAFAADGSTWSFSGATWTQLAPTTHPSARGAMRMVEDGAGVVLYGGYTTMNLADTWRWLNGNWTKLSPATNPGARSGQGLAFDSARARIAMFGGFDYAPNDTWEWNGTDWGAIAIDVNPDPRAEAVAVYQPERGQTLLFSGGASFPTDDTWEWDGEAWTERSPAHVPPARYQHAMAAMRDRVVLFAGQGAEEFIQGDTWTWDGTDWTQESPAHSPPARFGHSLAFDAGRNVAVLFGGQATGSGPVFADTWQWDGTDWTELVPATSPPSRSNALMVYDPGRGRTMLFGGQSSAGKPLADTWEWDGTTWTEVTPPVSPTARYLSAGAYDAARGTIVMFGGFGTGSLDDLWEWDGTQWTESPVMPLPASQNGEVVSYDAIGEQLMVLATSGLTYSHTWSSPYHPTDTCRGPDSDRDGLAGCADPDCYGRCAPLCPPHALCDPTLPHCGDGVCSQLEDSHLCPADCPPP